MADKKGEIILKRRIIRGKLDVSKYGPCPKCLGWIVKTTAAVHLTRCVALHTPPTRTPVFNWQCHFCGIQFNRQGQLQLHLRTHSLTAVSSDSESEGIDSDNEDIMRDINNKGIYCRKILRLDMTDPKQKSKTGRVFNTRHVCPICCRKVTKFALHIAKHAENAQVKELASLIPKEDEDEAIKEEKENKRAKLLTLLRNKGNHMHNMSVIEKKKGEFIMSRRSEDAPLDIGKYNPCPHCLLWVKTSGNERHRERCVLEPGMVRAKGYVSETDSCEEEEILRDVTHPDLYCKKVLKSFKSKHGRNKTSDRVFNAKSSCPICMKKLKSIYCHLFKHTDDPECQKLVMLKPTDDDDETTRQQKEDKRVKFITILRYRGNHEHNERALARKKGEIYLTRRPRHGPFDVRDYTPCPYCLGWNRKGMGMARHLTTCVGVTPENSMSNVVKLPTNHDDLLTAQCDECGHRFVSEQCLQIHRKQIHSDSKECEECHKTFTFTWPVDHKKRRGYKKVAPKHCHECEKTIMAESLAREQESSEESIDEDHIWRDVTNTDIYCRKVLKSDLGKNGRLKKSDRVDKRKCCPLCPKKFYSFTGHLRNKKHRDNPDVLKIMSLEKQTDNEEAQAERLRLITLLRFRGNHNHNERVLARGKGEILLTRKLMEGPFDVRQFSPCPDCLSWGVTGNMNSRSRHKISCVGYLSGKVKLECEDIADLSPPTESAENALNRKTRQSKRVAFKTRTRPKTRGIITDLTRKPWSDEELVEIRHYFDKFIGDGRCPRERHIVRVQRLSSKQGGVLHHRKWDSIKKKVNYLVWKAQGRKRVRSRVSIKQEPSATTEDGLPRLPSDNGSPRLPSDNGSPRLPSDNGSPRLPSDDTADSQRLGPDQSQNGGQKTNRQYWTPEEVSELKNLFVKFFEDGNCPKESDICAAQEQSRENGGVLHLRKWSVIKTKVNHMVCKTLEHTKEKQPKLDSSNENMSSDSDSDDEQAKLDALSSTDSESPSPRRRKTKLAKNVNRKLWTESETDELRNLFWEFFNEGTCPRQKDICQAQRRSRANGGVLHLRRWNIIKTKVNHLVRKEFKQ